VRWLRRLRGGLHRGEQRTRVGKAEAAYGRQVHWLRIERWLPDGGKPEAQNSSAEFCRTARSRRAGRVSVFAAYRTEEGLNGQVYNALRRDSLLWQQLPVPRAPVQLYNYTSPSPSSAAEPGRHGAAARRPMEKCTMCIQRIVRGKDHATCDGSAPCATRDIVTACQQTCPTRAITFGNLKDDGSAV